MLLPGEFVHVEFYSYPFPPWEDESEIVGRTESKSREIFARIVVLGRDSFTYASDKLIQRTVDFGDASDSELSCESLSNNGNTGLPACSDRGGMAKKCHCNQKAPYCVTVSKPWPIGKSEKCHCNQKDLYCVTVTGVTVSGEACIS